MGGDSLRDRLRFLPESGEIWLDEQRRIMVHTEAMGELRRELIESIGRDRARGVLTRMGYGTGRRDARFVRRMYPDVTDNEAFVLGPSLHNLEGIVNVTPDSFSDGGRLTTTEAALAHGLALAEAGADILDIGGESTRPGSDAVPLEEELARVIPVIEQLAGETDALISIGPPGNNAQPPSGRCIWRM